MKAPLGNVPVFPGPGRRCAPMVESFFIKLVAPSSDRALWLRWTFFVTPDEPPRAELWAVAFTRGGPPTATKRSEPANAFCVSALPFRVTCCEAWYDGAHTVGAITAGTDAITWDITLAARLAPLVPYPHPGMYRLSAVPTKTLSPIPDADARGGYTVNGLRVTVDGWRAMQGHNWGRRHTARYAWAHASGFAEAPDAVFEGFAALPRLGAIAPPWITMAFLHLDGLWLRFDGLRAAVRARSEVSALRWTFELAGGEHVLRGVLVAEATESAGLHYPNPTGAITYCLNSKLAVAEIELQHRDGAVRRYTTKSAALETAVPSAGHGVAMRG